MGNRFEDTNCGEKTGHLERTNRRIKIILFGTLLLAAVMAICFGAGRSGDPNTVVAERFLLQDREGKKRAVLQCELGRASLLFFDGNGNPRMGLILDETTQQSNDKCNLFISGKGLASTAVMSINDNKFEISYAKNNERLLNLAVERDGSSRITLGRGQIELSAEKSESHLDFFNPSNNFDDTKRASFLIDEKGECHIGLFDKNAENRINLSVSADGKASLGFFDATNKTSQIAIGTEVDGRASINLFDRNGKRRIDLTVCADGTSDALFFDDKGEILYRTPRKGP